MSRRRRGADKQGPRVVCWPHAKVKGWDGVTTKAQGFPVLTLREALEREHDTDAHFVPYVVETADGVPQDPCPRVNKGAVAQLHEDGLAVMFRAIVVDVDHPAKKAIGALRPAARAEAIADWYAGQLEALEDAAPELMDTAGHYPTRGGYRLVWELPEPLPAEAYEEAHAELLAEIEDRTGGAIKPDTATSDWTRCYRLPRVVREGERLDVEVVQPRGTLPPAPKGYKPKGKIKGLAKAGKAKAGAKGGKIREGEGRNVYLASYAGRLRESGGMDEDEIRAALEAHNAAKCDPPLPSEDLDAIAHSIARYPAGGVPIKAPPPDVEEEETWLELGSEVEIAELLAEDLGEEDPEAPALVWDQGALWRYSAERGIWLELALEGRAARILRGYDGIRFGKRGQLRITNRLTESVWSLLGKTRAKVGFFEAEGAGVVFGNGVAQVDEDGRIELRPHDPEARKRVALPFDYDPAAPCARWRRYLAEIFEGEEDAEARQTVLQEFAGACLTGQATRYHKAMMLAGDGANGKSTFMAVVSALFPPGSIVSVSPQVMDEDYKRAMLAGALLNLVTETPEAEILAAAAFKAVVDGSPITGRAIRQKPFTFRPVAGHLFAANELPGIRDTSTGFWRRWIVVVFGREFAEHEQDEGLADGVRADELPGVAAWALEGAARLRRRGCYTVPESSHAALATWRHSTDQIAEFIGEQLEECSPPDHGATSQALYDAYRTWCERTGHRRPFALIKFCQGLKRLGHRPYRRAAGTSWHLQIQRVRPVRSA